VCVQEAILRKVAKYCTAQIKGSFLPISVCIAAHHVRSNNYSNKHSNPLPHYYYFSGIAHYDHVRNISNRMMFSPEHGSLYITITDVLMGVVKHTCPE